MNIAILETGHPPERLGGRFPSYGAMVEALIGDGHAFTRFDVTADHWPEAPEAFDAFVITGSPASVYDATPWVEDLLAFLRGLDRSKSSSASASGIRPWHRPSAGWWSARSAAGASGCTPTR
nr:hypothetical protein [Methylorubrum sp. Q1]